MAKMFLTRRRAEIRSRPPRDADPQSVSQDAFEWACSMCTHATYLSAGVQKRVDEKAFRVAYVGIRPATEAALKCLWLMGKVAEKSLPQTIEQLVVRLEEVFPEFQKVFSVQMKRKDSLGNAVYRKVNRWAHADPEMWNLYRNGQEIEHVLTPLSNMVAFAQDQLLRYDPSLVTDKGRWSSEYK
jgi:hypothetical protein